MTFPNYYVVGPNIQFFFQHGVKGLFEEGNEAEPTLPLGISIQPWCRYNELMVRGCRGE